MVFYVNKKALRYQFDNIRLLKLADFLLTAGLGERSIKKIFLY